MGRIARNGALAGTDLCHLRRSTPTTNATALIQASFIAELFEITA